MKAKKNQKQVSMEEYIETYCQEKRIRGRFAVYISPQTHDNLRKIVQLFKYKHHTTTSSLADTIISRHVETYRELLNHAHREDVREFNEWMKKRGKDEETDDDNPQREEAESDSEQELNITLLPKE